MACEGLFDQLPRPYESIAAHLALVIIVCERDYASVRQGDRSHVREGLHEQRVASDYDQFLHSALVENPRITLGLLINIIMHNDIEPRFSQLEGKEMGTEASINKIAEFRLLFAEGSV
jgi:hypothetical protein